MVADIPFALINFCILRKALDLLTCTTSLVIPGTIGCFPLVKWLLLTACNDLSQGSGYAVSQPVL